MSIFIIFIFLAIVFLLNYNNYNSIQRYINNNQDKLYEIAIKMLENEEIHIPLGIKTIRVFDGENKIVQFDMTSFIKQYCGFYYSPKDIPVAFQNSNVELNEIKDNTWEWKSTGDNIGKTIKIIDNWYYFEASL